jgi:pSer/pThr/pTyr-binding forkhead associated (FHA) protein
MEVKLVVVGGKQAGTEIPVPTRRFVIGRGEDCHLRPHSKSVSRKHCAILIEKGKAAIEDFDSTNGTYVNGQRVQKRCELKDGDHIMIHRWEFEIKLPPREEEKTGPMPKVDLQKSADAAPATAAANEDDIDISDWLEKDPDEENVIFEAAQPDADDDTVTGASLTESPAAPTAPGKTPAKAKASAAEKSTKTDEQKPAKVAGRFQNAAKPKAETSGTAANDMLKNFFSKKR